jgi:hypothetical protein
VNDKVRVVGGKMQLGWAVWQTAHKLIMLNLALQLERFQIEALEMPFQQCLNDVRDVWGE